MGTGAEVRATGPERDVRVGIAADVEAQRVIEDRLVEVARDEPVGDLVVLLDLLAAELGVAGGGAAEVVDRGRPAEDLVGRRSGQARVVAEPLELVGVLEQGEQTVGDGVAGRLVAGDRQQQEVDVEVALVQRTAVDLGLDELGDDVLARALAPLVGELAAVVEHVLGRRVGEGQVPVGLRDLRVDRELGVVLAEQRVAELDQVAVIGLRRAEHLGEDPHRQLRRDLGDEVELSLLERVVEDPVEGRADALLEDGAPPAG